MVPAFLTREAKPGELIEAPLVDNDPGSLSDLKLGRKEKEMSKQQEEGLRWHPVYVSETAHAVRYVLAEDAMDAGDRFRELYDADGAFRQGLDKELQFTASVCREIDPDWPCGDAPDPEAGWDAATEQGGQAALAMWRSDASECVEEMRYGKIVAKRWGSEAPNGHQGLSIGFYDGDGEFVEVAIVEVDHTNDEAEEQVKVHVWNDDVGSDPDVRVVWVGTMPGNEA